MALCTEDDINEETFTSFECMTDEEKASVSANVDRLCRLLNWEPENREDLLDRENGCTAIREILLHFERWKSFVAETRDLSELIGLQHLIIYTMAKLCFYYWVTDSSVVVVILRHVYACDGHFSSMFFHLANQLVGSDGNILWRSSDNREMEYKSMQYFLYHAHKARLSIAGTRFVDLSLRSPLKVPPVYIATIYHKPKMLQHLLLYGAQVTFRSTGTLDDWNLYMLLRHMVRILWTAFGSDMRWMTSEGSESNVMSKNMYDITQSFALILRVIPQIKFGELNFELINFHQGNLQGSTPSHDFIRFMSTEGIVPKLSARYLEPSELQHLCRCVLREALNRSWNLPYGTFSLPLPKSLIHYINLSRD